MDRFKHNFHFLMFDLEFGMAEIFDKNISISFSQTCTTSTDVFDLLGIEMY